MKSYKVKLGKVKSNHNALRTDVVIGHVSNLPEKGKSLTLVGEGIDFGNRLVKTTEIVGVEKMSATNVYFFRTLNSTYKLEVLDEITLDDVVAE